MDKIANIPLRIGPTSSSPSPETTDAGPADQTDTCSMPTLQERLENWGTD
jgi:hypothetical protein